MAPIRIALLVCGGLKGVALDENGDYLQVYTRFFKETAPGDGGDAFTLDPFFVIDKHEYPDPEAYDALVLTGSASSAYDDIPWINNLVEYIARVAKEAPELRIIGICFGHQIIARALGGTCVPNNGRWEVGPTRVELTPLGQRIFGADDDGSITIQQMHRDHVPAVPPHFHLLGASAISPVQGMVRFAPHAASGTPAEAEPDPAQPLPPIQIFTVQGHPEFPPKLVRALVEVRGASGIIDATTVKEYGLRADDLDDGVGRIARAVWAVMRGEL